MKTLKSGVRNMTKHTLRRERSATDSKCLRDAMHRSLDTIKWEILVGLKASMICLISPGLNSQPLAVITHRQLCYGSSFGLCLYCRLYTSVIQMIFFRVRDLLYLLYTL
jgi:hypothetical protein